MIMILKFCLFSFLKITYSTEAIENPIYNPADLNLPTRGPQEIIQRQNKNESIIIPLHENHNDDHATGASCIDQNAINLNNVDNDSHFLRTTEHKNVEMRQKSNEKTIATIKISLPDVILNIDKECSTFLRCVHKTNKKYSTDLYQETEVNSKEFFISISSKKKRKTSMTDSLETLRQCENNYEKIHKKNKNDNLNICHPMVLAKNNEDLLPTKMYNVVNEANEIPLYSLESVFGSNNIKQNCESDILQDHNPDIGSGKVLLKNVIKYMFLGIETLNNFALNQFVNEKQIYINKAKFTPCYSNVDENLSLANCNFFYC